MEPIQIEAVRMSAIEEMNNEAMDELSQQIDCQNLLSGQDADLCYDRLTMAGPTWPNGQKRAFVLPLRVRA